MNEELNQEILEENAPYDLEKLDKKTIIDKKIFEYIFSIDEPADRERIIIDLEEKAEKLNILTNFKRTLKLYEKKYKKDNQQNLLIKQSHNEIGDTLLKDNNMYVFENDICIYENGVYKKNEKDISKKVIELIPDSTIHFRNEVYQYLLLKAEEKQVNRESGIINFKNGLFFVKERKMYNHSPKFFSINQINTNLNFDAPRVQVIDDVLDKLSSGIEKRKQTILEMIGYSMTTSTKLQKAFILYGPTARNGKSTLINIITELIGNENVGTVPFKEISRNKFAGAGIKGKLLNVGSEMTEEFIEDVSNFKTYITGDEIEIEEKFKPRQKIKPYAKFIFNANELPRVADKTDGFYRRLQIIPLEHSFTNKDAKKFNFNELIAKEALEYLARISLDAYLNMEETFSNYEESQFEVDKYKVNNNSVLTFIKDEEYIYSIINKTSKVRNASDIYYLYKQYCKENQYFPVAMKKFYKEIEKSGLIEHIGNCNHQKTYTFNLDFYNNSP